MKKKQRTDKKCNVKPNCIYAWWPHHGSQGHIGRTLDGGIVLQRIGPGGGMWGECIKMSDEEFRWFMQAYKKL